MIYKKLFLLCSVLLISNLNNNIKALSKKKEELHKAINDKNDQKVKYLLNEHGESIVDKSGHESSTLPLAYRSGNKKIVDLIRQYGGTIAQSFRGSRFVSDHKLSFYEFENFTKKTRSLSEITAAKTADEAIKVFLKNYSILDVASYLSSLDEKSREMVLEKMFEKLLYMDPSSIVNLNLFSGFVAGRTAIYMEDPKLKALLIWLFNLPIIQEHLQKIALSF
ncbi:MAG: hypothetical protein WDZ41_05700 [Candidatus Babeliales bacterium]